MMARRPNSSDDHIGISDLPRLGELEARAMEALWDGGGWSTPREVLELLEGERDLAYTTVMTILVRLWQKDLLERRKDGRAYAYHPLQTREEWTAQRMSELLGIATNRAKALVHFVSEMETADRDQLRRLLRADR
ncbi:MAG: BlaI/MecI/CopY family transcriptional regulator [Acidimicrobiia bacterium]|nr:BlaI/MecI/CopY family transcriptional regulator [Acidimicrobiia bacterium]